MVSYKSASIYNVMLLVGVDFGMKFTLQGARGLAPFFQLKSYFTLTIKLYYYRFA